MTENTKDLRHTGLWPFNVMGGLVSGTKNPDVTIEDPVALAFDAGGKMVKSGWVGLEVMPRDFRWEIVDADINQVPVLMEEWVNSNRDEIHDMYQSRLHNYSYDELAKTAISEALDNYKRGSYLSVVRTLMPEFERFGRKVEMSDGSMPKNQREAVQAIQAYLGNMPAGQYPTIEGFSALTVIQDDLFARCFTVEDAQNLGSGPNRHAEFHGLASYGNLQGATKILSATDFMVGTINFAVQQNAAAS